jgi:hypothetical protein
VLFGSANGTRQETGPAPPKPRKADDLIDLSDDIVDEYVARTNAFIKLPSPTPSLDSRTVASRDRIVSLGFPGNSGHFR